MYLCMNSNAQKENGERERERIERLYRSRKNQVSKLVDSEVRWEHNYFATINLFSILGIGVHDALC